MPQVRTIHSIDVGGRTFKVRGVKPFLTALIREEIEATYPQLRNLAWESRDLIYEKLLAGNTHGYRSVLHRAQLPKSEAHGKHFRRDPFIFDFKKPLKRYYLQRKVREGLDPRILIATGDYLRAIQVKESWQRGVKYYYVRLKRGNHKPSGMPYERLARLMEFGSAKSHLPPRPHWRAAWRLIRDRFKTLRKDIRADALRSAMRKLK